MKTFKCFVATYFNRHTCIVHDNDLKYKIQIPGPEEDKTEKHRHYSCTIKVIINAVVH